ncbi:MAG: S1 RNA-binding domain-containing protein [Candidatus Andersenbacteria bacterium]
MARPNPSEQKLQTSIDKGTIPGGADSAGAGALGAVVKPSRARPFMRGNRRGGGRGRGFSASLEEDPAMRARVLPELPLVKVELPKEKDSMRDLFQKEQTAFAVPQPGDTVKAKVIDRGANEVRLSIEGYGTGVVRGRELFDELDEYSKLQPGDTIEASVVELENENGDMELSFRRAGRERVWKTILEKLAASEVLPVKILDANKGGLIVVYSGVQGFIPVSQLTIEHYPRVEDGDKQRILERLQSYIGQTFMLKILDADPAEEKLIFSEKAAQLEQKKELFDKLHVGDIVEGQVTGIVDFGAFVQFDDLEGLVHISEMAWQRIDDPRDLLKVGQKVQAMIIGLDGSRISLSMKKLQRDPWLDAIKRYSVGQNVTGSITKVTPFGAFVQLDDDIHGLVHISELSLKQIKDPAEVVAVGDKKEFKILSIEPGEHRLGLSLKAIEAERAGIKVELPKEHKKVSIEEMEQMAAKKAEKEAKEEKTEDVVIPEVMGEKSEKALLDEKKHKQRTKLPRAGKAAKAPKTGTSDKAAA